MAMDFARPARPQYGGDIRPLSAGEINGRSLDELSASPASPLYRSKVPPPPCTRCNEDHLPTRSYDHEYQLDDPQASYVHAIEPTQVPPPSTPYPPAQPTLQRVAIYVGRNDTYVVAVEAAPDWDAVATFKVPEDRVLDLVALARALGVKVSDKTGGELSSLGVERAQDS